MTGPLRRRPPDLCCVAAEVIPELPCRERDISKMLSHFLVRPPFRHSQLQPGGAQAPAVPPVAARRRSPRSTSRRCRSESEATCGGVIPKYLCRERGVFSSAGPPAKRSKSGQHVKERIFPESFGPGSDHRSSPAEPAAAAASWAFRDELVWKGEKVYTGSLRFEPGTSVVKGRPRMIRHGETGNTWSFLVISLMIGA